MIKDSFLGWIRGGGATDKRDPILSWLQAGMFRPNRPNGTEHLHCA